MLDHRHRLGDTAVGVDVDRLHPLAGDRDIAAAGVAVTVAMFGSGGRHRAMGEGNAGLIAHGSVL
jgi:hypothetical protein